MIVMIVRRRSRVSRMGEEQHSMEIKYCSTPVVLR